MKYTPPVGSSDPNAPYVDADVPNGIEGSAVGAGAVEPCQREIVNVIEQAGLTPDGNDLTQLYQALQSLYGGAPSLGYLSGLGIGEGLEEGPAGFLRTKLADESLRRTANGLQSNMPPTVVGVDTAILSAHHHGMLVNTAVVVYTLPQGSSLWAGFSVNLFAFGGNITLAPHVGDIINGGSVSAPLVMIKGQRGILFWTGAAWYVDSAFVFPIQDFRRQTDSTDHLSLSPCSVGGVDVGAEFHFLTKAPGYIELSLDAARFYHSSANLQGAALGMKIDGVPIFLNSGTYYAPFYASSNSGNIDIKGGVYLYNSVSFLRLSARLDLGSFGIADGLHTCRFMLGSLDYPGYPYYPDFKGTQVPGVFSAFSFYGGN